LLPRLRVVIALGQFAYDSVCRLYGIRPKPKFGHGVEVPIDDVTVVCSFHPSQQNTFTRRLTPEMFDTVFTRAIALAHVV
jgi:uracil-DNA glycosylase